jgi:hypothetical protein
MGKNALTDSFSQRQIARSSHKGRAELGKTLYQVRADLFRDYLRAELRNPRICAI